MRFSKRLEWFFGFLLGVMAPAFGVAVFLQIYPVLLTVTNWADPSWQLILLRLTTFGIGLNVLVFFAALKFDKEPVAKGILWASILYIVLIGVMQFIG